jgi:hypothetical protein
MNGVKTLCLGRGPFMPRERGSRQTEAVFVRVKYRLDVNCMARNLDNLPVVNTSLPLSIGAVNPSLTAIVNAFRVGDHVTERLP